MTSYSHETYGERVAGVYDEMYSHLDPHAIDALADLAGKGPALELGIGTGRIALPLAERGIEIHGLDASPSMIEQLRATPGSDRITITQRNFAEVPVAGKFPCYAYPPEMDLMAQLAGLRLRERWSNWKREPFSSESNQHISIYE